MEKHRVKSTTVTDNTKFYFVEVKEDEWLDTTELPTHKQIHELIKKENKDNCFHMKFATRAFHIGIIPNSKNEIPIM